MKGRTKRGSMSYDTRCYELAEIFLSDENERNEEVISELAQDIQNTIEDFIQMLREKWEKER